MAEYIDIDTPIDVAVYQRNRRIQVTLRQILESNDAKYEPADVREVKRGKWIDKMLDKFRKYEVVCSECGARYVGNYDAYDEPSDFNFCPNCGADMRGENEDV